MSLPNSIQEEAEFDGDPTLELISDEKAQEMEQPAWAKKIMSCVQPKGIQFSYFAPISNIIENNFAIALVALLRFLIGCKNSRHFLNQSEVKPKPIVTCSHVFPALGASYMYLLRVLIGSLDCLRLLRLARLITLVLVLRHSIENCSIPSSKYYKIFKLHFLRCSCRLNLRLTQRRGLGLCQLSSLKAIKQHNLYFLEIVEDEESQLKASDEELDEDVFRRRKVELISGAGELKSLKLIAVFVQYSQTQGKHIRNSHGCIFILLDVSIVMITTVKFTSTKSSCTSFSPRSKPSFNSLEMI